MRKIWNKIRKIFASIGLALFAIEANTFAYDFKNMPVQPDYGVPVEPKELSFMEKALPIIRFALIPLLMVIGLIIFWKKGKLKQDTKIYITAGIIILGFAIYGILNWIENAGL